MKYEFNAAAIGIRMRQVRQAKGWSQEMLAEKANYTAQYISKLEKNGISDMELITNLSNILDSNLLEAAIDVEGQVGEIGKEILIILVSSAGFIETKTLMKSVYGLSEEQITNEIVKLDRIGLVVREIYTGWEDETVDRVFITAKGLVTLKNTELNSRSSEIVYEKISDVETYEMICDGKGTYQEIIDSSNAEKLIRNIYMKYIESGPGFNTFPVYRVNFVKYVMLKIENKRDKDFQMDDFLGSKACTAVSCYHDILYRMALKINNEVLAEHLNTWDMFNAYDDYDWLESFAEEYCNADKAKEKAITAFISEFGIEDSAIESDYSFRTIIKKYNLLKDEILSELGISEHISWGEILKKYVAGELELTREQFGILEDLRDTQDSLDSRFEQGDLLLPEEVIESFKPQNSETLIPCDWFTKEEIEEFINENFGAPKNEIEKGIDKTLNEIIELVPEVLEYYIFPKEWEQNGLADLVRKNIGLNRS